MVVSPDGRTGRALPEDQSGDQRGDQEDGEDDHLHSPPGVVASQASAKTTRMIAATIKVAAT